MEVNKKKLQADTQTKKSFVFGGLKRISLVFDGRLLHMSLPNTCGSYAKLQFMFGSIVCHHCSFMRHFEWKYKLED